MIKSGWCDKKIMCGHCKFKCCTVSSFYVEISEKEQFLYKTKYNRDLPRKWKLGVGKNKCVNLSDKACTLGDDKPSHSKSYPLELKKDKVVIGNWCNLHCPKPRDYEFVEYKNKKYHYKLIEKPKYKSWNKLKTLELPEPIETFFKPIGSGYYNNYAELMKVFNETNKYNASTLEEFML